MSFFTKLMKTTNPQEKITNLHVIHMFSICYSTLNLNIHMMDCPTHITLRCHSKQWSLTVLTKHFHVHAKYTNHG